MTGYKPQFHRRPRSYMDRQVDSVPTRQSFLIVCEGTETEPRYFRRFRVPGLVIEIEGTGRNTISLIEEALRLSEEEKYDQVWCVFDKDDFSIDQFERAIQMAKNNSMRVAYSNQAFELWYVLHFNYMKNAITRIGYKRILSRELRHKYEKNSPKIYDELRHLQTTAIRNAKRLLDQYHPSRPARNDPSTTVHLLVEQLVEFSMPFGIR